jgi:polysaccharide export outer membrane protein
MRHARLALLLLALPAMAGCVTNFPASQGPGLASSIGPVAYAPPPPMPGGPIAAVPVAVVQPESAITAYTLDSGDRLRIVVFGQDGLTNSYAVDSVGNITLPLIGPVHARGRTTTEVSAALSSQLRQGFLREPHVAVEVEAYRPFFILGEVTFPGQYPYVPNMTVETAVAIAGGFSPRAFRKTVEVDRPVEGAVLRTTVPVTTLLRPGDTVVVAERWF